MAMASVTRSSRRADGPLHQQHSHHAHHHRHPHAVPHFVAANTRTQNILRSSNSTRTKRQLDAADRDFDAIKPKKARITVEILSRQPQQSRNPTEAAADTRTQPQPVPATARSATIATPKPPTHPLNNRHPPAAGPPVPNPARLTKHQEKVINGIRHELNRLQPSTEDTRQQGRKLRSQEATRFKSELSAYFPDYDEVIGNDPKEEHILNLDTPIIVVDLAAGPPGSHPDPGHVPGEASISQERREPLPRDDFSVRGYGDALFSDLFDSQRIDFSFLEARYKGKTLDDPLPDSYFEPSHKKAERLERSIRNSEKGRAQHEKDQIIRLLEGLQGHDWLRTMGVSGITESKKKTFEPAREHFIKGCQAILEKFRLWNIEEKRRKMEKERAIAEEAEAAEAEAYSREEGEEPDEEEAEGDDEEGVREDEAEGDGDRVEEDEDEEEEGKEGADKDAEEDDGGDVESDGDPPDYSDVDASIAKQLRDEVMARSKRADAKISSKRGRLAKSPSPPPPPEPQPEFTSFFRKKYQRDAALSKGRRRGRTVVAWGHTVPEPAEAEFQLPDEYRDQELLRAHARRKRRDKRGSRH